MSCQIVNYDFFVKIFTTVQIPPPINPRMPNAVTPVSPVFFLHACHSRISGFLFARRTYPCLILTDYGLAAYFTFSLFIVILAHYLRPPMKLCIHLCFQLRVLYFLMPVRVLLKSDTNNLYYP